MGRKPILKDGSYTYLLSLIFSPEYSNNIVKTYIKKYPSTESNVYQKLKNINGGYYKFIKEISRKRKRAYHKVNYALDYEGIIEFVFTEFLKPHDKFFQNYFRDIKEVYDNPNILVMLKEYLNKTLNEKKTLNLYGLFEGFVIKTGLYEEEFNPISLNNKINIDKLTFEFINLCKLYNINKLTESISSD